MPRKSSYKVLMIAPTSFFSDYGAHVRPLEEIRALQEAGHEVTVCTYHTGNNVEGIKIKRSLNVPWKKGVQVGSSRHKLYFDAVLALRVLQVGLKEKPDIIHAHLHEGALIGYILKLLSGGSKPLVFDFQGSLTGEMVDHKFLKPGRFFYRYMRKLEKTINQLADVIVTSSHNGAGVLKYDFEYPAEKVVTITDRVNCSNFHPYNSPKEIAAIQQLKQELGIPLDHKVVVYLGLLAPYQGINVLLEAAKLLKTTNSNVHFVIMGYPGVDSYRELASYHGLDECVIFPGRIPYQDAPRYLAMGDIAVAPKMSTSESVGKIANYMAMGLPTVCFDTPTSREYLGDLGIYATLGDAASLAQQIKTILEDEARQQFLAKQVRQRAVTEFSWQQTRSEIEAVYEMALAKTKPQKLQPTRPVLSIVTPAADSSYNPGIDDTEKAGLTKSWGIQAKNRALRWLRNSS